MNVAQLLVKCLEKEGVKYIFGIPGEEVLDIMDALQESPIQFITVRHEQGAAFMADVYGRLTGHAGVCLSTLGPGATNLVTGVTDANSDGAPLVAITGQVSTDKLHLTAHQYLDINRMFAPITKRTKEVLNPETEEEIVRLAFKYAENEMPGATHISIPVDIAKKEVSDEDVPLSRVPVSLRESADRTTILEAYDLIKKAKRPILLVGNGAIRSFASAALTRFVQTLHIPVINTMMAKGVLSCDDPYYCCTVGLPLKDYGNIILEQADTVIAVGYDIVEYDPRNWNAKRNTTIVHIASMPADINKYYQTATQVVGYIPESLDELTYLLGRGDVKDSDWALKIIDVATEDESCYLDDASFPMKPQKILMDARKVMGEDDILISDVGAHKMWVAREYPCFRPNTCLISNGFASMGFALPGAIAAKLIYPKRKVLVVTGDGGLLMNIQELETAVRIHTPIVVLIFHDSSYGLIKWKQMDHFGRSYSVDFDNPDFVLLAESFHAKGYRVTKAEDLIPILQDAFAQDVPCLIDCPVDYDENLKLSAHLKEVYEAYHSGELEGCK